MDEQKVAALFKALADENRIHILRSLRSGEKCACMLLEELNISQPTLSHHMRILCDCGIVEGRKAGKWIHYSINCQNMAGLQGILKELFSPKNIPESCCCEEQ